MFHEISHDFSDFHLPEKFPRHFFQGTPDQVAGDFEVGEGGEPYEDRSMSCKTFEVAKTRKKSAQTGVVQ